jgi:hypothetical protein
MSLPGGLRKQLHSNQIKWLTQAGYGFYRAGAMIDDPMSATHVGSLCEGGMHRVAVDLELAAVPRIMDVLGILGLDGYHFMVSPSSTAGHWCLFVDVVFTWDEYRQLLSQMVVDLVISAEDYAAAVEQGMSRVSRPGITVT